MENAENAIKRRLFMKTAKKILAGILSLTLALSIVACGASGGDAKSGDAEKIDVVVTSFYIYDWVRNVIGEDNENIDLKLLVDSGVDFHSYQPTTGDIAEIISADLFIYNGGHSDEWVNDLLADPVNEELITLNLMDSIEDRLVMEETIEGMQDDGHDHTEDEHDHAEDEHDHAEDEHDHAEDEHDHAEDEHDHTEDEHDHTEDEHDHVHADEHIWLSLLNAIELVANIEDVISDIDSANAETYESNAASYISELETLEAEYVKVVEDARNDTILVADRFPFRYLIEDYDLNYYAAFSGCSAETEASFETMAFLTDKVETEINLNRVIILEGSPDDLATTIIDNTTERSGEILVMNSLQSVTSDQLEEGLTYLSVMDENLGALMTVLL